MGGAWDAGGLRGRCQSWSVQATCAHTHSPPPSYPHPQVSVTFRDMANNRTNKHQWIVLDGDIDAEWIESMNTGALWGVRHRRAGGDAEPACHVVPI